MSAQQSFDANSEILAQTRAEFEASRKQVFFVDSSVPGYEALVTGLSESGKVFTIDANSNALAQIASALESVGGNVDGVHIYSHGRDGALLLGGQWIDTAAVDNSADILNRIGSALTANADVLLYGCNVAKSSVGQSFMERVAALTRADVAASSDVTGNANNWNLEKNAGAIETAPVIPTGWEAVLNATAQWGVIKADGSVDADGTPQTSYTGFVSNDIVHVTGEGLTVDGGQGNDIYYVDNKSGVVTINEGAQSGDDTVITRVQNFTLNGGAQVETILLDDSKLTDKVGQSATGNKFTKMITGNALDNNLTAGSTVGGVTLNGGDGNDYLDDGDGSLDEYATMKANVMASTLIGGKGDDNYIVHHEKDVVTELANQGTDHVLSAAERYTLAANVENLTLLKAQSTGVGNAMNNVLKSTQGNSSLDAQAGNDTLYASQAGNDTLNGGAGNDAYYVYGTDNSIVDSAGTDSVYSTVDFDLGADNVSGVEHLFLQGDATKGTGNKLNNRLVGNETVGGILDGVAGNNTLEGGYGDDLFVIRSSNDMVIDKGGKNTIEAHATVDLNRFANATVATVEVQENTTTATSNNINVTAKRDVATSITGNSGNNVLTGGNMDDTLNAGTGGTNRLVGGLGNDVYYVRNATDTVVENANQGTDEVHASVDYTLTANVENLSLRGTAKQGTGNNLSNVIDASAVSGAVLHGGVNAAGLQGDTFKVANGGNQIYSYNANDTFVGFGSSDVLYVSYNVAEYVRYNETKGASDPAFDWNSYFRERGRDIGGATVIYRGNPVGTAGAGVVMNATGNATNLVGTDRADTLTASVAATLDGGKGGDSMRGSSQGDVFYVDSVGVNAVANTSLRGNLGDIVDGGSDNEKDIDTIRSSVNIDLNKTYTINNTNETNVQQYKNIEVVELQGTAGLTARGYAGQATSLYGNSGNNQLFGGSGNDYLDGGLGADVMTGGAGNDKYYIDNAGDRVVEQVVITNPDRSTVSGGVDSIYSNGININLASGNHANVEYVENIGTKGISMIGGGNGTTTTFAEEFHAGAYGDTIDGKGGADVIYGGAGDDRIYTYGTDVINSSAGSDTLVVSKDATRVGAVQLNDFSMIEAENFTSLVSNNVEIKVSQGAREHIFSTGAGNDSIAFADDSISARNSKGQTVNVNISGFDIYSGGNGNDTLDASKRTEGIALAGGLGADQLLGGSGSDTLIADGGNDILTTGEGHDVVKITRAAVGSSITIRDFDALMDSVNDSELKGWTRTITQSGANCTIVWTNPEVTSQRITAVFQNTVGLDIKFGESKVLDSGSFDAMTDGNPNLPYDITASGTGQNIRGGNSNDVLKSTGSNNTLYGGAGDDQLSGSNGGTLDGGAGDDIITLNDVRGSLSVDGGAGDDSILLNSVAQDATAILTGGAGNDTLTLGSKANVSLGETGNIASIAMDGKTLTVTDGTGFESIVGSGEADSIVASGVTSGTSVTYTTNGGNDTFTGGAGNDVVSLHTLDSESTVSLSGGAGKDSVYFANQAMNMSVGESVTIGKNTIRDFEGFFLGSANDTVTADIDKLADKTIDGGAGTDRLNLAVTGDKGVFVELDSLGNVSQMGTYTDEQGQFTPAASATATGFETIDGSANSRNYFDASAYTVNGGTFQLTGGAGHDMFYLGGVKGNARVTLSGGAGDDRFHLGDVVAGSAVYVDGGTDSVSGDRLYLNTSKNVNLQLNAAGNISAVSLGGTKVAITSNGMDGYYGGHGNDVIDARNVTSVDSASKTLVLKGCRSEDSAVDGNDYLYASKNVNVKTELHAGKGADTLHGDAGNDVFYLGNAAGQVNDGRDYIITGSGRDTIVVHAQADRSTTRISDFNASLDTIDDGSLLNEGWARQVSSDGSRITYSKGGEEFYLDFVNKGAKGLPSTQSVSTSGLLTVETGFSGIITGHDSTKAGDTIDASNAGPMTIMGNGGNDSIVGSNNNDSIEVKGIISGKLYVYADKDSSNDSVTPKAGGNDRITVSGAIGQDAMVTIHGGLGNDMIMLDDITGGEVYIAGRDHSKNYDKTNTSVTDSDTVKINDISGGMVTVHTSGNASTMKGATWGLVDVQNIKGNAQVEIDTGNYNDTVTINSIAAGADVTLTADEGNDSISITSITGGTSSIDGQKGDDTIAVTSINGGAVNLLGNAGADSIDVRSIDGTDHGMLVDGGLDDDVITVVQVRNSGEVVLQGAAGNDSISIQSIVVDDNVVHELNIYGDAPTVSAQDGDDTVSIGLVDNALVKILGGDGADSFTLDKIEGEARIYIDGGNGADTVTIGTIGEKAKIHIDAGNNPESEPGNVHQFDALYFTGDKESKTGVDVAIAEYGSSKKTDIFIRSIEAIEGTAYDDTIDASGMDDNRLFDDMAWQTVIKGGDGDDVIYGGASLQLRGGNGEDLLVVTGLSTTHDVWVRGDNGTDTLSLESLGETAFTLQGGFDAGNPVETVSRAGLHSANGDIVLDDTIEAFNFGAWGYDLTWNAAYDTKLLFDKDAANRLTLREGAAGSTITIENYGDDDVINAGELLNNGWTMDKSGTTDATCTWTKDSQSIVVKVVGVGSDNVTINDTYTNDVDLPPVVTQREIIDSYDGSSVTGAQNLLVKGDGLLVQTGSGDDTIAFDLAQGCIVEAGEGNDVIEVFGVDASVLTGTGHNLALDWNFFDEGGKTRLNIGLGTGSGDYVGSLQFRSSGGMNDLSELAGDTVNLYGASNDLLASFDLQSILDASSSDNNSVSGMIHLNEGTDKKFS